MGRKQTPSQRELAEQAKVGKDYFSYWNAKTWTWVPKYIATMDMREVICTEPGCKYVPRRDSTQPRRAFRAHVKKDHPRLFAEKFMKPYIIREEPDFSQFADVALAYA